jgi:hypothetical protein
MDETFVSAVNCATAYTNWYNINPALTEKPPLIGVSPFSIIQSRYTNEISLANGMRGNF